MISTFNYQYLTFSKIKSLVAWYNKIKTIEKLLFLLGNQYFWLRNGWLCESSLINIKNNLIIDRWCTWKTIIGVSKKLCRCKNHGPINPIANSLIIKG